MCKTADYCGVKSGAEIDKFEKCGITAVSAVKISSPIIEECPVSIECIVREIKPLGTHDMFISEIVGVDIEEKYIDSKGKLNSSAMRTCLLMLMVNILLWEGNLGILVFL